jgi:hypothetical protein
MKPIIVVSELTGEYYITTSYRKTAGHIVAQTKYLITREELEAVGLVGALDERTREAALADLARVLDDDKLGYDSLIGAACAVREAFA